ncbi:AHH domain-containing protein [Archangium sp.]|uniref:AHH domain-containing protein n=1 Tax=Archangium sp. TaxID=1872627 RepID=UPI002D408661|nr:AHH domain-containing protein [Archangium sp.]HYO54394.1 AHH domain-containing protein [Archangium sp.]
MSTRPVGLRPVGARLRPWFGGWALIVLCFQAACATGAPASSLLVGYRYQPLTPPEAPKQLVTLTPSSDFAPVELPEAEFREAFTQFFLEVPLPVAPRPSKPLGGRFVRASWQTTDARGADVERGYARLCERRGTPGDCHSLMGDGPHDTTLSERDRFTLGIILAIGPAMEGAAGVLKEFSAHAVTAVCTGLALYFIMLIFPDPVVSKGIGAAMTLFLWGYLGMELWGLISATERLWDETKNATTFQELREASERYGRVLGPNTMRLLILLATWKAGVKGKEAMKGGGLPRFPQAVQNAATAGRIRLPAAAAEAEAVSVAEGRLTLTLPSGSAAILALQKQGGGEEGDLHHIATVENMKSTLRGGPWTQRFKAIFDKAGMSMEDPANKVRILGHRGPHPEAYHKQIYKRLKDAVENCDTTVQCRDALTRELRSLADEIAEVGSKLNKLVTQSQ